MRCRNNEIEKALIELSRTFGRALKELLRTFRRALKKLLIMISFSFHDGIQQRNFQIISMCVSTGNSFEKQ